MKKQQASEKITLKVEDRTIVGKKTRILRTQGKIPANIYGTDFKSRSISVGLKDFITVYRIARETGVVYVEVGKDSLPVMIKHVSRHPVNDKLLHVDFRKIDLKKKIETEVPVKTVGESIAVTQKGGVLLIQSEALLVEALPEDIPTQIDVDLAGITEIGQEIKVQDLPKSAKYEVKTPAEKVVISVVAHKEESITPETTAAAPEIITEAEKGEAAAEPGAAPAEGGKTKETAAKPEPAAKK